MHIVRFYFTLSSTCNTTQPLTPAASSSSDYCSFYLIVKTYAQLHIRDLPAPLMMPLNTYLNILTVY